MIEIKCPSCGKAVSVASDEGQYLCPHCQQPFALSPAPKPPAPEPPPSQAMSYQTAPEEVAVSDSEQEDEGSTTMWDIIAYIFYFIALVDFCGMFFHYDLTGVRWSPVAFSAVGYFCQWWADRD